MDSALFGVSVLSEAQEPHSRHFAGEPQSLLAPRFAAVEGLPDVELLEHAAARFAARVVDRHPCGDHTLFVGEVLVFSLDEHAPLIFFGGRYGSVTAGSVTAPGCTQSSVQGSTAASTQDSPAVAVSTR
jgi:flavin reductase (DIM6/NTAB) family NADH-FMN oxidoreductase RutF